MDDREVLREYDLKIRQYEEEQIDEYLCSDCLFRGGDDCRVFCASVREIKRTCMGNYRLDKEVLVDAMRRKLIIDTEAWNKWIASFPDFMGKDNDDAKLYVVKSPDDIVQIHKDLEKVLGE